jgi:DNA repair exonuclease SbcCD nuclease subunit
MSAEAHADGQLLSAECYRSAAIKAIGTAPRYPHSIVAISPSEFCFVHAADLHLDTPFRGLHEIAPEIAVALREASLDAFDAIVDLSIERAAAFLLIAGDVYDGAERGLRAQLRFRDGLARLDAAGIPSFVVHGNHDPVATGWSAVSSWPDRVTIFSSDHAEVREILSDGVRIATVQGISYATAATTENLALRLHRPEGDGLHIGLLHCNVQGVADEYDNYSPCTIEDLRNTGLDYLALGHIHQRRVLNGENGIGPWIVYAGNSQARSPRKTEQEPKGAVVVHVAQGSVDHLEFVPCDSVRYVEIDVPIEDIEDLAELGDALEATVTDALAHAHGRSVVLRARLTGRGSIHHDLSRSESLKDLLLALRDIAPSAPFCWWDSIDDATSPALDLDDLRQRGDFAADLLQVADEVMSDGAASVAILEHLIDAAPNAIQERARSILKDEERLAILFERARLLAIDKVVGSGA